MTSFKYFSLEPRYFATRRNHSLLTNNDAFFSQTKIFETRTLFGGAQTSMSGCPCHLQTKNEMMQGKRRNLISYSFTLAFRAFDIQVMVLHVQKQSWLKNDMSVNILRHVKASKSNSWVRLGQSIQSKAEKASCIISLSNSVFSAVNWSEHNFAPTLFPAEWLPRNLDGSFISFSTCISTGTPQIMKEIVGAHARRPPPSLLRTIRTMLTGRNTTTVQHNMGRGSQGCICCLGTVVNGKW